MQIIEFRLGDQLNIKNNLSLCLGYFDGIHLGHKELINRALFSKYKSAVLTFKFEENFNLKNSNYITSLDDKKEILSKMGVDYLFVLVFDQNVKNLLPNEFVEKIILKLNAKELIVGEDYRFGKMASGNIEMLKILSSSYKVIVVNELKVDNEKIGTSRIIPLIKEGDMKKVKELLGYYYKITGFVEEGYKLGNKYDFPTANVNLGDYVVPKKGVYFSIITINGKDYYGMCNIGTHPTINKLSSNLLEVNIFDFDEEIYGKKIAVSLVEFIREEKNFNSIDDLYNQLKEDKIICLKKIKEVCK